MSETPRLNTGSQKMAQEAYKRVLERTAPDRISLPKEYASFARSFPSLIHSCGLAQAVAFAQTKGSDAKGARPKPPADYLEDLAEVLKAAGCAKATNGSCLAKAAREEPVPAYLRLSRSALQAAGWLKRYVEALAPTEQE